MKGNPRQSWILDSKHWIPDSGFQVLDSSLFVGWTWIRIQISNGILDSLSRIPDSAENRIAGFWIPRARISPISESKFRLKERNFQSFWRSSLVFVSLINLRSWLPWRRWPTSHDLLNLYFQFFFLMGLTAVKRRHFLGDKTPPNSESWSLSHKSTQCMVYHCQCYLPCGSLTWRHQRSAIWASFTIAPCKGIQDSLGFWVPVPGFRILCQWNLDSGFQSLLDSGFPELYSGFHKKKILGIPEMGRLLA